MVEMDAIFYEEFYSKMTRGLFFGMVKITPENFEFSIKVPERITYKKRLDLTKDVISDLDEFLNKISPLYNSKKLDAILIQLPLSLRLNTLVPWKSFWTDYLDILITVIAISLLKVKAVRK